MDLDNWHQGFHSGSNSRNDRNDRIAEVLRQILLELKFNEDFSRDLYFNDKSDLIVTINRC